MGILQGERGFHLVPAVDSRTMLSFVDRVPLATFAWCIMLSPCFIKKKNYHTGPFEFVEMISSRILSSSCLVIL